MDKELIDRLMREAGAMEAEDAQALLGCFPRFASLIAEECANVAEDVQVHPDDIAASTVRGDCAFVIRRKFRSTP
jgi:hypothetical protein